jgi:hypothetical protein
MPRHHLARTDSGVGKKAPQQDHRYHLMLAQVGAAAADLRGEELRIRLPADVILGYRRCLEHGARHATELVARHLTNRLGGSR